MLHRALSNSAASQKLWVWGCRGIDGNLRAKHEHKYWTDQQEHGRVSQRKLTENSEAQHSSHCSKSSWANWANCWRRRKQIHRKTWACVRHISQQTSRWGPGDVGGYWVTARVWFEAEPIISALPKVRTSRVKEPKFALKPRPFASRWRRSQLDCNRRACALDHWRAQQRW